MAQVETSAEKGLVVIIMGSESDLGYVQKITKVLDELGVEHAEVVGSAHKTPMLVDEVIQLYNQMSRPIVYCTTAGRSDALSAFVKAKTTNVVIAAPPPDKRYGLFKVLSSLDVPSGIGLTVALYPEQGALAAASVLKYTDPDLERALGNRMMEARLTIYNSGVNRDNPVVVQALKNMG